MSDDETFDRHRLAYVANLGYHVNPFRGRVLSDEAFRAAKDYERQAWGEFDHAQGIAAQMEAARLRDWASRTATYVAPKPPPEVHCDLCGAGMLGRMYSEPAPGVVYCLRCDTVPPRPLPRESWWLRALRWMAKL